MVQRPRANNIYKLLARPFSPYQGEGIQSSTNSHPLAGQFGHQYHTPEYNLNFGLQHLSSGHLFQETLEANTEVDGCGKLVVPRERSFSSRSCDHTANDVRAREPKCWWTFLSHQPILSHQQAPK